MKIKMIKGNINCLVIVSLRKKQLKAQLNSKNNLLNFIKNLIFLMKVAIISTEK